MGPIFYTMRHDNNAMHPTCPRGNANPAHYSNAAHDRPCNYIQYYTFSDNTCNKSVTIAEV